MNDELKNYFAWTGQMASQAMAQKANAGLLPTCPPVGYRIPLYPQSEPAEVDPFLGPLVQEAFELASTGQYSLRKLLAIMRERGLISRTGKPMGVSSLWSMLTNPFYAGKVRYKGELLAGAHRALVSKDPTERRRDWLANFIAERTGPELARRFWLSTPDVLRHPLVGPSLWRQPGSAVLRPLVAAHK